MNTNPGDLFIIRNVGNFIPPYSLNEDFHGTASAIEYAVEVLKVSEIVICGHTYCGACATLHKLDLVQNLPHLKKWLEIGEPAKNKAIQTHKKGDELLRETEKQSLINQIENLLSYPNVLKKVENGNLHIHGWFYHIENGAIEYFDSETEEFLPLDKLLEK
jgi:carbonic anhydrase